MCLQGFSSAVRNTELNNGVLSKNNRKAVGTDSYKWSLMPD